MKTSLDYKRASLCVLTESKISDGPRGAVLVREWHPVHAAEEAEVRTLVGRPVTEVNSDEGIYLDEEGNVFQLAEKGRSKPMEVEQSAWEESRRAPTIRRQPMAGRRRKAKRREPRATITAAR